MTSAIAAAFATLHAKHDNNIRSLREMLEEALPAQDFISPSSPSLRHDDLLPNTQVSATRDGNSKSTSAPDSIPKISQERWNQGELGYFDPHFDKAYGDGEVVSVGKDVYYKNVLLFVQCI